MRDSQESEARRQNSRGRRPFGIGVYRRTGGGGAGDVFFVRRTSRGLYVVNLVARDKSANRVAPCKSVSIFPRSVKFTEHRGARVGA